MRTVSVIFFSLLLLSFVGVASAQQTITLGIPTSLNLIEGKEANLAARLAIEEINAKGGVKVGNEKRLFKVESIDIRDGEPGVPVSEALLGIEKLILDKKTYATVVGNFRSEALARRYGHLLKVQGRQYRNHSDGAQIRGTGSDRKDEVQILLQDVP